MCWKSSILFQIASWVVSTSTPSELRFFKQREQTPPQQRTHLRYNIFERTWSTSLDDFDIFFNDSISKDMVSDMAKVHNLMFNKQPGPTWHAAWEWLSSCATGKTYMASYDIYQAMGNKHVNILLELTLPYGYPNKLYISSSHAKMFVHNYWCLNPLNGKCI